MSTHVDTGHDADTGRSAPVPAYGPVQAVLGYALFFVVVDRVTPSVVAVFTDVLAVSPAVVRFGLAAALWFVFAVMALDHLHRQLAALGVLERDPPTPDLLSRVPTSESTALASLVLFLVGGLVAVWTFDAAVRGIRSLLPVVATADATAALLEHVAVIAVFFVAFGVSTHALDRLVVGGIRSMLADR